ncbi:NACHT, LRR and PYD domains-containing protein 3-like isoform X2 [Pyxicephalus adspersus]|uniref:NACHT, LRR and PYD domains-containing protein 3-like isoform X2 n=1 Tax=Pyxicephalus adspersus TaxID=30357 RepID=UPI003B5BD402
MDISASTDKIHLVDLYREKLIQHITMVHPVLDHLLQESLLTQEHYNMVMAQETTQEKMRMLYRFSQGWSNSDKDIFHMALKQYNPGVIDPPGTTFLSDLSVKCKKSTTRRFQNVKEYNSRTGETVSLQKKYTQVLLLKKYRNREEREEEITSLGRRHIELMNERSSGKYSPTTIQDLFKPDEDGIIPTTIVLQGPAGIGKTMTSQKIILDWAYGNLYQDMFDFVFHLSCRELNNVTSNVSLARLLSRSSGLQYSEEAMKLVLRDPGKILIIIDGLDELTLPLEDQSEVCEDPFRETQLKCILKSLLKRDLLCEMSLVITTRPCVLQKLNKLIEDSCNVDILGFTGIDRENYIYNFYKDKNIARKVLKIIKENEILFTMCAVPITCWILCTVLEQEIKKDLGLIQCTTTTSVYILYLKGLIKYHGSKRPMLTCLKKVCALAHEGVFHKRILFEETDLRKHGLSMTEVESMFLNENMFHQDIGVSTCYSFIHLTVQEFFAALYYVLKSRKIFSKKKLALYWPCCFFGKSLTKMYMNKPHLSVMVQFLYGLTDGNQLKELSEITGCELSFRATSAMRSWLAHDNDKHVFITELICCLYEMQDKDFVRTVMSRTSDLTLQLLGTTSCTQQLAYCLKTRENFQRMTFLCWKMEIQDLQILSPILQKCSVLKFSCADENSLPFEILCSIINESTSVKELAIHWPCLQDSDVRHLCELVQHPGCNLQTVRYGCLYSFLTLKYSKRTI